MSDKQRIFTSILFALFISSGIIKGVMTEVINLPIDITIVFALLTVLSGINYVPYITLKIVDTKVIFIWFLFLCFYLSSAIYSISEIYIKSKILGVGINTLTIFIALFYRYNLKVFGFTILVCSIFCSFFYLYQKYALSYADFSSIYSGMYLSVAMFLALGMIITNSIVEHKIVFVVSFVLLLLLGGRGPILFYIVASSIVHVFSFSSYNLKSIQRLIKLLFAALISLIILIWISTVNDFVNQQVTHTEERLSLLIDGDKGSSVNERFKYIETSVEMINDNIFWGAGLAMFPIIYEDNDSRGYPHNIILELWSETGLFSTLLLMFFLLYSTLSYSPVDSIYRKVYYVCIIFILLNLMKSSAFEDVKFLFAALFIFKPDYLENIKNEC